MLSSIMDPRDLLNIGDAAATTAALAREAGAGPKAKRSALFNGFIEVCDPVRGLLLASLIGDALGGPIGGSKSFGSSDPA
ncbi:MAG: hypothetical protein HYR88_10900 [Verrucomicrobia bacterium]|nr:hypothetical protein [Verrucomicrobiota bacterium]MBI3869041.1 hypothetical protein [Verrucomicrobiota bacterium]